MEFVISSLAEVHGYKITRVTDWSVTLKKDDAVVNVYWSKYCLLYNIQRFTVQTTITHPKRGRSQLSRRDVPLDELEKILINLRHHTGKGYYRMNTLAIDIETFSDVDLSSTNVYKYVETPAFEILLFAYKINEQKTQIVDFASGEKLPKAIREALTDVSYIKTAYNVNFERTCLSQWFCVDLPVEQWECTMVKALMMGYPGGLDATAAAMKLDLQKDKTGKALIRYFSIPCKPTKSNGLRTRNLPKDDPVRWDQFRAYCVQDVNVEHSIRAKTSFYSIPALERQLWFLDQKMNDRGVMLDMNMARNAIRMNLEYTDKLVEEAVMITGIDNPNSVAQIKKWIEGETDETIQSLAKEYLPDLINNAENDDIKRVLQIRQELSKSSVKKYNSMVAGVCEDSALRGILQYYGANRTGRWAGRKVQVHNLPKNYMKDLDMARKIVSAGDLELLEILFGNVPNVLSELVRTAFVPREGKKFWIADFNSIEARVVAWLAKEKWRMDVFAGHGKIYEASGAKMFKVPIESITKGSKLRDKAKIAELALGYQGGVDALLRMGAEEMGIDVDELPGLVTAWRKASPAIVKLWARVNACAIQAIREKGRRMRADGLEYFVQNGILFIKLPSGRCLSYLYPELGVNRFGLEGIRYYGVDQVTKKWWRQDTYGGKLVENIVQAIARDCLADSMLKIDHAGYDTVLHVHDELVVEIDSEEDDGGVIDAIMKSEISWAPGLVMKGEGFDSPYYLKR